jgi:ElaB/YqjD/DUF883 family membrane-anchored ribosome-binding protein
MPNFHARYYDGPDVVDPCRVDPVEAQDRAAALALAEAAMLANEIRVELAELEDVGAPRPSQPPLKAFEVKVGEAVNMMQDRYEQAYENAAQALGEVERFVKTKPYAALGIAALFAYVVGLHVGAGRKRVIYLKPER